MSQSLEVTSLLERFDINQDDLAALKTGGDAMKAAGKVNAVIDSWYVWLEKQPEFPIFFSTQETVERVKRLQTVYWENFFSDEIDQDYVDYRVHIGQIHAQRDLSNLIYFAAMARFNELFSEAILSCGLPASDLDRVFNAFNKLIMLDAFVTSDQVAQFARRRVIESGKAMLEMSTPVTSIWDGILLLPLVGVVDSQRTQDIMDKSLSRIAETRARMFVMDISGVVTVDTAVANNFIRITQATRLMGCDCIISGISPNVARTLVELGANVGEVRTTATLRDALQLALATLEPTVRGGRGQGEGALR
ncbi:MAG: protoglobin domain-containing protein [Methyloceanibacter sp.]|jgi:rsbT co-antagonist protein RsbR|uniref:protoglobin domain-containing protein n=1 Tax=Methyloceanibacter sp. TaxID=1965321 RepID=UPI003C4E95BA